MIYSYNAIPALCSITHLKRLINKIYGTDEQSIISIELVEQSGSDIMGYRLLVITSVDAQVVSSIDLSTLK